MSDEYTFTREQLGSLLQATIDMYLEFHDVHGKSEESAKFATCAEMIEGLDGERQMVEEGASPASLQTIEDEPCYCSICNGRTGAELSSA